MKFRVCILPFFLLSSHLLLSQTQLTHPKGSFLDSENRYFHQADLPLYLYVSHEPNQTPQQLGVRNQGESTPQMTAIQLDGHGIHYLKHEDVIHKQVERFPIHGDGRAPISVIEFQGAEEAVVEGKTYYSPNLQVELSATDKMSGLAGIYHSINQQAYQAYQTPDFLKGGEYTYQFYAVDRVGNVEEAQVKRFFVDTEAPSTDLLVEGTHEESILAFSARIKLQASDNLSGVNKTYYQVDQGEWQTYSPKGILLESLEDGDHQIRYFSQDRVDNEEDTTTYSFYLDRTSPIVTSDILGDKFIVGGETYFSGRTKLKLTSVDNKSGVKSVSYSLDNEEAIPYDQPFYLPEVSGRHTISYFALDRLGNKGIGEDGTRTETFTYSTKRVYLDLTGPDLFFDYDGPTFQKVTPCLSIRIPRLPSREKIKSPAFNRSATKSIMGMQNKHTLNLFSSKNQVCIESSTPASTM